MCGEAGVLWPVLNLDLLVRVLWVMHSLTQPLCVCMCVRACRRMLTADQEFIPREQACPAGNSYQRRRRGYGFGGN